MHSYAQFISFTAVLAQLSSALPLEQNPMLQSAYFQGDMLLYPEQLQHLTVGATARNALYWERYRWPDAKLKYSFTAEMSASDISLIESSMAGIAAKSCVRFERTTNPSDPQVVFQRKDAGCWSYMGYVGNRQALNLGMGCMWLGTVQHEVLHALGFAHMQSDPTRDEYVRIVLENIIPGKEHNFNKYASSFVNSLGVEYDYGSIMHYSRYAFSKNNQPTIVPLQAGVTIGQNHGLSAKDFEKLNLLYCKSK